MSDDLFSQGSPFCKLVRETLVELELPHLLHRYLKIPKTKKKKSVNMLLS
jgi:hypothetical protein